MSYHRAFRKARFGFMNWLCAVVLASALVLGQRPTAAHASTQIVRVASPGESDISCGGTWATACDLKYALGIFSPGPGDTYDFWVRQGTYRPTPGTNRSETFQLKNGVSLLGGFAGTEVAESQRDPEAHVTTLSGAIGTPATDDNSYHVVTGSGTDLTAVLDGFTVSGGQASGTGDDGYGAGMINNAGSPRVYHVLFVVNWALAGGGGMYNVNNSFPEVSNVYFDENWSAGHGGGMLNSGSSPSLEDVTFTGDSAGSGGAIYDTAASSPTLSNITMYNNQADDNGGAMVSENGSPVLTNVTLLNNFNTAGSNVLYVDGGSLTIYDSIIWDQQTEILHDAGAVSIFDSILYGDCTPDLSCTHVLTGDPLLSSIAYNGGLTPTLALGSGSPAIDSGNNGTCLTTDQRDWPRPVDGNLDGTATCDMGAYEYTLSPLEVDLAGAQMGTHYIRESMSARPSYPGSNNGPAKVWSTDGADILAAERVIYAGASYSEMMGYPGNQLTNGFWFPWYNNTAMNSQLRISNVGTSTAFLAVSIGNNTVLDSFALDPGAASRTSYAGVNNGPLHVWANSGSSILATIRVIYGANSYSEMMGYSTDRLTNDFWFPWYNNTAMNSQLRVSNLGSFTTTVQVYIGNGTLLDTFLLPAGVAIRKDYPGQNNGPIHVVSSAYPILATIRVVFGSGSYSELLGYPGDSLSDDFWFPAYDDVTVDSQVRVSNVGGVSTNITVFGGDDVYLDSFALGPGAAVRKSYAGRNGGPLRVVSTGGTPILATIRTLYGGSSYYEMFGVPADQLTSTYWFPWYNDTAMSTELHLAVP